MRKIKPTGSAVRQRAGAQRARGFSNATRSGRMHRMKKACLGLVLLASVLLPLALPNDIFTMGNPFVGLICVAPLFAALCLSPSLAWASLLGAVFGALSTLCAHYWLLFYGDYSFWTIGGVVLGYMIYHSFLAPVLAVLMRSGRPGRFLLVAAAWTAYEYVKSSGFLGFPWGLLAHAMASFPPFLQIADVTGTWGVTFAVALANSWSAELLLFSPLLRRAGGQLPLRCAAPRSRLREERGPLPGDAWRLLGRQGIFVGVVLALLLGYGVFRCSRPMTPETSVRAVLVQHNENPWSTGRGEEAILAAQELSRRALAAHGEADIVVWSETAIEYFLAEESLHRALELFPKPLPLGEFIREIGVPLLVGAPFRPREAAGYQNAALLFGSSGELLEHYGKRHLVPLAERIPFYDFPPIEWFFGRFLGLSAGWERGSRETVFELPLRSGETVTFSTPICFEDAFPDLCRRFILGGADMLINLTNVAWSRRESAQVQMHAAAVMRSIENRRTLLRATNAGVTSVIGPRGESLGALDMFTAASLVVDAPVHRTPLTVYTRLGDYFPFALAFGVMLFLVWRLIRGRRSARRKENVLYGQGEDAVYLFER